MQAHPRDPQARVAVGSDDSRVLSVPEAVTYIDEHYHSGIPHLISKRSIRRYLGMGRWP